MQGVLVISGIPGSGKTTVARLVAERFDRSVHIEGDLIGHHFIVRGLVPPQGPPQDEAERQLLLRRRNICLLAASFAEAGFVPVVDDVVVSPGILDQYRRHLHAAPLRVVQLTPDLDVVASRDAGRDKHVFELWKHLYDELHQRMERVGLWVDTSDMTADETTDVILDRLDEALVNTTT